MPLHTINPVKDEKSKILILGSFPSVLSRESGFFYGHPQNRFWPVLINILQSSGGYIPEEILRARDPGGSFNHSSLSIDSKLELLKGNRIALWDTLISCDIRGSEDSSIKNPVPIDLKSFIEGTDISCIYLNGTRAYNLYNRYLKADFSDYLRNNGRNPSLSNGVLLPSTSPANSGLSESDLTNAWRRILTGLMLRENEKYFSLNSYAKNCRQLILRDSEKEYYESSDKALKLYKLSLNGGFTCPNRDGTKGSKGCIFCNEGAGDFAGDSSLSIKEQIKGQKELIRSKLPKNRSIKYIAYFQAYTGSYASVSRLEKLYMEAVNDPEVAVLSVATRPDCLGADIISLLSRINKIKPVWIELGLQTASDKTAQYIRRGYETKIYDKAVKDLMKIGISQIITHVILGLPGENEKMILNTVKHVVKAGSNGIKLQLLHVNKGTDLEKDYEKGLFKTLTMEEYLKILKSCLEILPPDMPVHRLTGDGNKKFLVAPLWSSDKKRVLNAIRAFLN